MLHLGAGKLGGLLILLGLAAGAATLLGGALALRLERRVHLILGFSAGAVVGVALFDLLPEALSLGGTVHGPRVLLLIVAAGFAGYLVLMFLSFALWWALANVMDIGLAALIVAILWGVIGAVAFTMGRKKFKEVHPKPERTVDTLSQVPGALKPH